MIKTNICLALIFSLTICTNASATQIHWTAGNALGADWNNSLNWDLLRVPVATDSVMTLYGDKITISPGYTARATYFKNLGRLQITGGGMLVVDGGQFDALGNVDNYGSIWVTNANEEGMIFATQAANVTFENHGNIYIDQTVKEGFRIKFDQVFTNHSDGYIQVSNAGLESFSVEGIFNNSGIIILGSSATGVAVKMNQSPSTSTAISEINNLLCGKIILQDKFVITDGVLNNNGFLKQNYADENDLQGALSIVNNYAVVEDIQGSFDSYDFDVQTIWLQPLTNLEVNTGEPTAPLKTNFPASTSYSNIFTDHLLTQNAGNYNGSTNIWIPNANANGLSSFYMEITQTGGACKDTVRFDLETPVLATTYWLGGNGNWQNPVKWSTGIVPTASDLVGIYGAVDDVFIPVSTNAFAKTIALSGTLTVRSMATLAVDGAGAYRGIDVQQGTLLNNGTINVNNCAWGVYLRNSSLTNQQTITCFNTIEGIYLSQTPGFIASLTNSGIISNNAGDLIDGDEAEIYNTGSFLGKFPTNTGVASGNLKNEGIIDIEGSGSTGTGVDAILVNEATGTILTKKLNTGAEIEGTNSGSIRADSCTIGIEISSTLENLSGAELRARYSTYGMILTNGSLNNKAGALLKITHSSLYGLYVKQPQQFISAAYLFNDGLLDIDSTAGKGIYCLNDITNQAAGVINVKNSGAAGVHVYIGTAYLLNKDQAMTTIFKSGGNGLLVEGGKVRAEGTGQILIDKSILSGIHIKDYVNLPYMYPSIFENEGQIVVLAQ